MAKLTEKERAGFEKIMKEDLMSINVKLMNQIKDFWTKARTEVERIRGFDKLIIEKDKLGEERNKINARIQEIEAEMRSESLRPEQVVELGGRPDRYGYHQGANFYGIPVGSQFDYQIVEYIREHIDLKIPVKFLHDLARACMRELAMSGTFEDAKKAYKKFYSLDFKKYGVDIPPRLNEISMKNEMLLTTKQTLQLGSER
jgi:hypothetical protein